MNDFHDDQSLSDDTTAAAPDINLALADPIALVKPKPFTVDEVLASARLIERTASVCLRADLTAEWDELLDELATLVTATGEMLEDDSEDSMGEVSGRGRVTQITTRMTALRREMAANTWRPRFRALPSDEWPPFLKKNRPKGDGADLTEFFTKLIAETALDPDLTVEKVKELRKVLGDPQIGELTKTAWQACTAGGIDVPKLPSSLAKIADAYSGS